MGGAEFIFLNMELLYNYTYSDYLQENNHEFLKIRGKDNLLGIVLGAGIELALSQRLSIVGSGFYSLSYYDGNKIFSSSSESYKGDIYTNEWDLDLELNLNGFNGSIGLRYYLGKQNKKLTHFEKSNITSSKVKNTFLIIPQIGSGYLVGDGSEF